MSANELRYIVGHADRRVLITDASLVELAAAVVGDEASRRIVVTGPQYEAQLDQATPRRAPVNDEPALMALDCTSGPAGARRA